jgi:secondary thiamine-phosphate synthase enzyme
MLGLMAGGMKSAEIRVHTGRTLVVDITQEVERFCAELGHGLCHLFAPHATAGLALMETGSGSEEDLAAALDRILPRDFPWRHRHGSFGHGADHLLPVLVSPSLVLAVRDGRPILGTWQSIVLVDPNKDNPERRVILHFLPAAETA